MHWFSILLVALLNFVPVIAGEPPSKEEIESLADPDGALLRRQKIPLTSDAWIGVVRKASAREVKPPEIAAEIAKLGNERYAAREQAGKRLAEIGPVAVASLRRLIASEDTDLAKRAREVTDQIVEKHSSDILPAAVRVLLRQRERSAVEPLIKLLPFIHDPDLEADIWYGLDRMAGKDAKVVEVIGHFLKDDFPARRAIAANFSARYGGVDGRTKAGALLSDPDSLVKLRAAQGLLAAKDSAGVSALIGLLDEADIEIRFQSEELLRWIAMDTGPPTLAASNDGKSRLVCQAAWKKCWSDSGERIDFTAHGQVARRPLLLLAYDRSKGRAWLVGCDGITRHAWTGVDRLTDARLLPGGLLLAVQGTGPNNTGRSILSLRYPGGATLWTFTELNNPVACQRLSSGRFLIIEQPLAEPPGRFEYQVVSAEGIKAAALPPTATSGKHAAIRTSMAARVPQRPEIEATPHAGYLVSNFSDRAQANNREIMELNGMGRATGWQHSLPDSTHAFRLRSGTTLACTPTRILEIAPDHRQVSEVPTRDAATVARPVLVLTSFGFDTLPPKRDLTRDIEYRVRSLSHESPFHRQFALDRLAEMNPSAAGVLADIKKLVSDPDPQVRAAADRTRQAAGDEAIPGLLAQAKDADPKARIEALIGLAKHHHGTGVLETVLAALIDDRREVRAFATTMFGSEEHIPHQGGTLSPRANYEWAADRVIPALVRAATDPKNADHEGTYDAQIGAIRAIGRLGKATKPAVEVLIKGLTHERTVYRYRCAEALGGLGAASEEVVSVLIAEVARADGMRGVAAISLGEIGPPAARAIDALVSYFNDRNKSKPLMAEAAREATFDALVRIGPSDKRVVTLLQRVLEDPKESFETRLDGASKLCRLGPASARSAIPVLEKWVLTESYGPNRSRIWGVLTPARYQVAEPER
jgi:HEAT repeat protein